MLKYHQWLVIQQYEKSSILRLESIQRKLNNYLETHSLPTTQKSLQSFIISLQNQGYSTVYLGQIYWGVQIYSNYLHLVQGMEIKLVFPKVLPSLESRTALSQEQILRIESWLNQEQADYWLKQCLWCLFYGSGLRRQEVLNLHLQDLDIRHQLLHVKTSKGGKQRVLPLSQRQTTALVSYIKEERPKPKEGFENKLLLGRKGGKAQSLLGAQLQLWQDGTGLGRVLCWHVLRHTIATNLVEKGMKIEQVSHFLGHKNVVSTSHYLHYLKPRK